MRIITKVVFSGKSLALGIIALCFSNILLSQTVVTRAYTGSVQTWTVPSCVSTITVDAKGAQGGGSGGNGGRVQCIITVTPGDVFSIYVGGQGAAQGSGSAGGYNGGGNAGICTTQYPGAGGGGATDIRLNGNALSNRIVVAGGGGGSQQINNNPGVGGGLNGGNCGTTANTCIGAVATGGTQTAGGSSGTSSGSCCTFTAGSPSGLGVGGNGSGPANSCNGGDGGGGGGGGYYGGGGGGAYSAGAGGSSYTQPSATSVVHTQGSNSGNGALTFTYNTSGTGVTISAPTNPICSGNNANLIAGSALTFTWLPVGSFLGSNASSISVSPTSNTTYTVQGINSFGCTSLALLTITVNAGLPSISIVNTASATSGICPTKTVALTASGANTYSWTGGSTTVTNGVVFSPTISSGYTVTGFNACGSSTAATSISIHPFPTVGAVASTPSLCSGLSLTLTATGNAATYTWNAGVSNGVGFFPSTTNTYVVTGTSALTCTASASAIVTVVTTPSLTPTASPISICIGKSSTLTATGATNYTWLPGNASTNSIAVSPTAVVNTYTVIKSNANCVDTKTINVFVNQLPSVLAIASPTLVCAGKPSSLFVGGAQTYTWTSPGPPTYTFSGASPMVYPPVSSVYTVVGTDVNGCQNNATVSVSADPNPTITVALSSSLICQGQSISMTASGGVNYTWTSSSNSNTVNTPGYTDSPTVTTAYNITADNSFSCTSSISQVVIVNPIPTLTTVVTKTLVCTGGPSTITVSGANTYTWDASVNNVTTAVIYVNPIATTIYTVQGKYSGTGCQNTKTVQVKVFTPTITVTSPTNTCYGGNITLMASGANPNSYNWNIGSGFVNPGQMIAVTPTVFTVYTVSAISGSNGVNCPSTQTTSIGIFYNPTITATPQRTLFCRGEVIDLYGNGGVSYSWSNAMNGATITVSPNANTNYTVTGTDANGCVNTGTIQLKVFSCVGVNELNVNSNTGISVYPNPNNGTFSISSESDIKLNIVNELGQLVRTIHLTASNNYKVDISDLANGIYFMVGENEGLQIHQKIIVNK